MVDVAFLKRASLFAKLSDEDAARVAAGIVARRVDPGGVIFYEGQFGLNVYLVRKGKIKICRFTPGGKEQIIAIWGEGAVFGLVAGLDGGYYPATAIALNPSTVWALPVDHLNRMAAEIPTLAMSLMHQVGHRIRLFQERLYEHDFLDMRGRLVALLLSMARATGVQCQDGVRVAFGLTHQDLGAMIGTTRETVTRLLNDLRRQGLLDLGQAGILLREIPALEALAKVE